MSRSVVVLSNGRARILELALAGFDPIHVTIDPKRHLSYAAYARPRTVLRLGMSMSYLIEKLRRLRPGVVVLLEQEDTRNILPTLFRELCDTHFISIQSAWRFESAHLHLWWPSDRRRLKILVWGHYFINQSVLQGRDSRGRYPVGSLEASLFSEFFGQDVGVLNEKQLCLIVKRKFGGPGVSNSFEVHERRKNVETLMKFVGAYCRENGMTAVIPVDSRRNDAEHAEDVEWCESLGVGREIHFGIDSSKFEAVRPNWYPLKHELPDINTFHALSLAAGSALTIGTQNSAVIWNSLALGYPTLATGFGSSPLFEFPVAGAWKLQDPDFDSFSGRVSQLLRLPSHRYPHDELAPTRHLVNHSDRGFTVRYLRGLVKRSIQGDSSEY